jgi:quercetin dioxygenase-like cupin family protein
MPVERARSGEPLSLDPSASPAGLTGSVALVRDDRLEAMRWMLPAGRAVPEHAGYGPATIQCLIGVIELRVGRCTHRLGAGSLVYLAAGERHSLTALSDSVLLITMVLVPPPPEIDELAPGAEPRPVHGERRPQSQAGRGVR